MPDYGLTEALAKALQATKEGAFTRAPEAAAAAREGKLAPAAGATSPIPGATPAPVDPTSPESAVPKPAQPDVASITEPTPPGGGAPPPPGATPDAPPGAAPPPPNPALTPSVPDPTAEPPGAKPARKAVPSALPGDQTPGLSPQEAAGAPPKQGAPSALPPAQSPLEAAARDEATRFVTANIGDFKGKLNLSHMPNVDTMASPDGMKAAILQVADDNASAIDVERRGTISNEQLLGLAQDLSLNTDVVGQVMNRELGTQLEKPETMLAARLIEQNTLGQAMVSASKIASGTATMEDILEYARQKQNFVLYHQKLAGAMTEQGRGLNAAAIPAPGTLPPEVSSHIADILRRENPDLQAEVNAVMLANSPVGIANIMTGSLVQRAGIAARSLITRIFVNGILSGPPTWAKIFIGNTYNLGVNTFDLVNAGMVRGAIGMAARMGRFPTSSEGAQMADAFTYTHGVISGGADALRLAARTLRTGVSLDNVLRFDPAEVGGAKNVNPALGTTQSVLPEIQGTWFGSLAKGIDMAIDAPGSRAIGAIDEFTKTLGARGYRTMMVMKEIRAQLLDGTLKPGDEGVIAKQMFENPSPEMLQAEEAWAHRMTFQSPFPEGGPGEAFSSLIQNKIPALKFIFPFMRTATNIFKQSIGERTPLALLSARFRAQLAAGGFEGDIAKGRIASGTAIAGMLGWMAIHDQITGDAPKDPKERELWAADGRSPYSIKITDPTTGAKSWRSYAWMEPTASIAGIVADSARAWARINQDEEIDTLKDRNEMYGDMVAHIVGAIIANTGNKTFMTGASKFSEMYGDPEKGHALANWATDMGTSLVPFSKSVEFVRNVNDPYLREAWTLHDKIMNDIPGESQKLGVARDLFGNPRTHGGPMGKMSPFPSTPVGEDAVTDELHALMDKTHEVPFGMPTRQMSMPGSGSGKGILGGAGMPLTSQEYSELVQKARLEPNFDGGTLNLHDKLAQVIKSPVYDLATPAERTAMLSVYATKADQIGRDRLFNENQAFRERLVAWATQKNAIKFAQ